MEPAFAAAQARALGSGARRDRRPEGVGRGRLSWRYRAGLARPTPGQSESTGAGDRPMTQQSGNALAAFTAALATGAIRVVDLTQTLAPEFPSIVMPPEIGQSRPFRMEEI